MRATNGRTRRTNRKMTQWEAYDLLPPAIQRAMQEGPQQWDTCVVLARWRKLAAEARRQGLSKADAETRATSIMSAAVWRWHGHEIATAKPWLPVRQRVVKGHLIAPSPHLRAEATMQTSGRAA